MPMPATLPLPQFCRFEHVRIVHGSPLELVGQMGIIVWRDPPVTDIAGGRGLWTYVVTPSASKCHYSMRESSLQSLGTFDQESDHFGLQPEISFDLVMDNDMSFVEGTYRLPGKFWEVFIFSKAQNSMQCGHRVGSWKSGITGINFLVPSAAKLNRDFVMGAMEGVYGYKHWLEVRGPDSMVLR